MGIYKHSLKMLKLDFRKCIFFIAAIVFSTAIVFNFFNVTFSKNFTSSQNNDAVIYEIIALVVIVIAALFVFFANTYFIMSKTKEIAIAALSGINVYKLSQYLFYQTLMIILIAFPIGLVLGTAIMPIFTAIMHKALDMKGSLWEFSGLGFVCTVCVIAIQFIFLLLVNTGYAYRKEIKELLTIEKQVYEPDRRTIKIPRVIYLIIYLLPILLIFLDLGKDNPSFTVCYAIILSTYGTQGVIRYFLPNLVLKLKKKRYIHNKIKLVALSNLHYSLRKANYLIVLLAVSIVILISFICGYSSSPRVKLVCIFSYVVILFLISMSMIYKVLIEAFNRKTSFKQIKLIGYTSDQIVKIIKQENSMFFSVVLGVPLIHVIILLFTHLKVGAIGITLALFLAGAFVIVLLITSLASYKIYKNMIFKFI